MQVGAQAAVAAENLLVDDRSYGQAVETVREGLPQLDIVATLALIVKSCRRSAQTENSLENENRTPISELENRR